MNDREAFDFTFGDLSAVHPKVVDGMREGWQAALTYARQQSGDCVSVPMKTLREWSMLADEGKSLRVMMEIDAMIAAAPAQQPYTLADSIADEAAANVMPEAPAQTEPSFDLVKHLRRQREFSERTFGPGRRVDGVCDHIGKELAEIKESDGDLSEWVDVILLALDGAWRSGATPEEIVHALSAKQTKNEGRTWPDWRTAKPGTAIEHDRSAEPKSPAKPEE